MISEHRAQQSGGCADRTQCEVSSLHEAARNAHQPYEDRGHDQVDSDQDEIYRRSRPVQNPRLWRNESVKRDRQKRDRVNKRDHGAPAISENPKVVHDQNQV